MVARRIRSRTVIGLAIGAGMLAMGGAASAQGAPDASLAAVLRLGDSAWAAGRFPEAKARYAEALRIDSLASSRAVFRLATLTAWDNRLGPAIALFRRYRRLEPTDVGGFVALGRTLAWASRFDESLAVLDSAVAIAGDDPESALLQANVLAWAGRLGQAEARYRALAATGRVPEAERGIARVTAWRGELARSAALWREMLERRPDDVEALVGLAQVERWMGRPVLAREALARALRLEPGNVDARQQLSWVDADLELGVAPSWSLADDSDGNRVTTVALGASRAVPWWAGAATGTAQWREAVLPQGAGRLRSTSVGARGTLLWTPAGGRTNIRLEGGLARLAGDGAAADSRIVPTLGLRVAQQLGGRLTIGIAGSSTPFDETAPLIAAGIRTDGLDADWSLVLPARLSLGGGASVARVSGDTANTRRAVSAAVRWVPQRGSSLGIGVRSLGYDRFLRIGYFSPQEFTTAELQGHFELPRDLGWNVFADAGLGQQRIRILDGPASTRGTQRGAIGVLWRPRPGQELSAQLSLANVASPFARDEAIEYRAGSVTVRGRLMFR